MPEHWQTFGQRASLITGGPRLATNPANAILNYLYALLEAETSLACHTVGLDPGLGIFHTDRRDRASLALELMEAARPAVDSYVLALLTQRTLSAREFLETREGSCRITPRFAEQLGDTCKVWRSHIAPVVEQAAHTLAGYSTSRQPALTPLTRRNWKRAWDQRAPDHRQRRTRSEFAALRAPAVPAAPRCQTGDAATATTAVPSASPTGHRPGASEQPNCCRSSAQNSATRRTAAGRRSSAGRRTPRTRLQ